MIVPLAEAARGMRLTNERYQKDADVTQYIASRDLKKLSDLGLIEPVGEKRGRIYLAGKELKAAWGSLFAPRIRQRFFNPYDLVTRNA